jgi:hypothetical protein
MISSCASHAENFSAPNVDTIAGVQIKRLPAGEAIGSHDLERWATRRSAGFSRSYTTKDERHKLRHWTKLPTTTQKPSHDGAAAAAARGILVQRSAYARGWVVSLPDGSNKTFKRHEDALSWIERQPARGYGR